MLKLLALIQTQDTSKLSSRLNQKDSAKLLTTAITTTVLLVTTKQGNSLPAPVNYTYGAKPSSENAPALRVIVLSF